MRSRTGSQQVPQVSQAPGSILIQPLFSNHHSETPQAMLSSLVWKVVVEGFFKLCKYVYKIHTTWPWKRKRLTVAVGEKQN